MKTIEERAKEYSLKDFDGYYTGREKALEEGYIAGAAEQRMIDIDKACKWFESYLAEIGYPDDWCRDSEVQESGEERSMISPDYARNFICDFVIGKEQPESQLSLFD